MSELFRAAVAAADPYEAIKANLPREPKGRTVVIGAGKASVEMARAFDALWKGSLEGVVVTKHGTRSSSSRIEVIEAAHPVPDEASFVASRRLLDAVSDHCRHLGIGKPGKQHPGSICPDRKVNASKTK
ncbi:DUF4147 domain-containing protein [Agrobacterium fabrum]|uniref:DUF4147 domain-containing protein n=1 Tax=Agrobacterium fabrum TaxID=1176649 RepID=UPI001E427DD1|nr:DUF4147 domain-containing protein [Agrobacterium fabrum]